jgi:hypothetical protein
LPELDQEQENVIPSDGITGVKLLQEELSSRSYHVDPKRVQRKVKL